MENEIVVVFQSFSCEYLTVHCYYTSAIAIQIESGAYVPLAWQKYIFW